MKLVSRCLILAFALVLASAIVNAAEPAVKPNIVFIMADDHTSQAWGCYGSRLAPFAKTPNIDRLAREGARLDNCFCTNSICVPSRASILTGQYSHVNGFSTLREALDPGTDHVAKRLQRGGYQTALVGKWHLKNSPAGFDYWNIIKGHHPECRLRTDLPRLCGGRGVCDHARAELPKQSGWSNPDGLA